MSRLRQRDRTPLTWSKRDGRAFTHGKASSYSVHGCGCDACYAAFASSPGYLRRLEIKRLAADKRQPAHP